MKPARLFLFGFALISAFAAPFRAAGQTAAGVTYTLVGDSVLLDDCLICGRPTLIHSLRGTFTLVPLEANPLFATYRVTNVAFRVGVGTNLLYEIAGAGLYRIGGEVAVRQEMTLESKLNGRSLVFTNGGSLATRPFPFIEIDLAQTEASLLQFFSLKLVAAPMRELWFSTTSGFTSGLDGFHGSSADLLSAAGRVVRSGSNLVAQLGLLPGGAIPDVDALDVAPGGEVIFSFRENQNSSTLGLIQHGDLVSDRGRRVARNQTLTAEFGIMPVVPDVGLDAVMVRDDGEILFSITTDVLAERLGKMLRKGDLLSSRGQILASNAQLLSRFHPAAQKDYGLDALHVWPGGEIWFSTEEGFQDAQLGPILAGDLLSDQGIVIFRNLDLLAEFAPVEDLADFGLNGLFLVTDMAPPLPSPRVTQITHRAADRTIELRWTGPGRVFQVEKATEAVGPYLPYSPLIPGLQFDDAGAGSAAFYRLRQW